MEGEGVRVGVGVGLERTEPHAKASAILSEIKTREATIRMLSIRLIPCKDSAP